MDKGLVSILQSQYPENRAIKSGRYIAVAFVFYLRKMLYVIKREEVFFCFLVMQSNKKTLF